MKTIKKRHCNNVTQILAHIPKTYKEKKHLIYIYLFYSLYIIYIVTLLHCYIIYYMYIFILIRKKTSKNEHEFVTNLTVTNAKRVLQS